MKKRITALILLLMLLTGCVKVPQAEAKLRIYTSFYPLYAMCGRLLQDVDDVSLNCLVQPQDGCLRNYALSDWDFAILSEADVVVIGGRGLESFENTLYSLGDNGPAVLTAMQGLYLYQDSHIEQTSSEDSSHLSGANPYLYLSFSGASQITEQLADALTELLPTWSDRIQQNDEALQMEIASAKAVWDAALADRSGKKVAVLCETAVYPALDFGLQMAYQLEREPGTTLFQEATDNLLQELTDRDIKAVLLEQQAPADLVDSLTEAGFTPIKIDMLSSYPQDVGFDGYLTALGRNAERIDKAFQNQAER